MKLLLVIFLIGFNVLLINELKKTKKLNRTSSIKHEALLIENTQLKTLLGANSSFKSDNKHPTDTNAAQSVSLLAASVSTIQ